MNLYVYIINAQNINNHNRKELLNNQTEMGHCCSSTNNSNTSAKPTSLTRKMTNNSFINRLGSKKYNPLQGK